MSTSARVVVGAVGGAEVRELTDVAAHREPHPLAAVPEHDERLRAVDINNTPPPIACEKS